MSRLPLKKLFKKRNAKELMVYLIPLIILCLVWLLIILAKNVMSGDTIDFDKAILSFFRNPEDRTQPVGPEWVISAVRDITALGSSTIIALIVIAVSGFLILKKEYKSLFYILFATIGGAAVANILKIFIGRQRPEFVSPLTMEYSMSFPSGHSVISAVVYLSLALLLMRIEPVFKTRIYILSIAVVTTLLVGISRVYLGVHFPTDVLAGWILGLTWALFCWFLASTIERRNRKNLSE
ncbi:MAG: phosphatase PAP2 family protein [bacterium]